MSLLSRFLAIFSAWMRLCQPFQTGKVTERQVTERLNEIYSEEPSKMDQAFLFAQSKSLKDDDSW